MKKRILIIDDSPTLRKVLKFFLIKNNYSVTEASDGEIGLKYINNNIFDLIILDLNMPVLNGFEVLEKLKGKNLSKIPVIILTGDKREKEKVETICPGNSKFMTKPFKPVEIITMIQTVFENEVNI
ncbi:MAG: response regulator [Acidobacteriota bacterium]